MEAVLKKYFWVLQGLGLAIAVGLAASAINTQFGTSVVLDVSKTEDEAGADAEADEDAEDGESKLSFKPSSTAGGRKTNSWAKQQTATAISERNVFCPTCMPAEEVVEGEMPVGTSGMRSNLNLKLMATMEAENPEYSLATIRDEDAGTAGLYGVGDIIRQGVAVASVEIGRVHLQNNGRLEYIAIGDEPPRNPTPSAATASADTPPKPSSSAIEGAADAINCPNENLCIVERDFVEKLLSNPAMLAKQARVVPSQKDGETQGYKFYGIRRDSLPKMLGLKNGDLLTEINGESLGGDMTAVMGLLTKLRRASNLSVTIQRRGQTITKEVQIQ